MNVHKVTVSWRICPCTDDSEFCFDLHTRCCGSWQRLRFRAGSNEPLTKVFHEDLEIKCPTCKREASIPRHEALSMAARTNRSGNVVSCSREEVIEDGQQEVQVEGHQAR